MAAVSKISNGKKWHDLYPELGTEPIPIDPYVSHECFERERALIFRKVWLNVGRVEQIPKPGDYLYEISSLQHVDSDSARQGQHDPSIP